MVASQTHIQLARLLSSIGMGKEVMIPIMIALKDDERKMDKVVTCITENHKKETTDQITRKILKIINS